MDVTRTAIKIVASCLPFLGDCCNDGRALACGFGQPRAHFLHTHTRRSWSFGAYADGVESRSQYELVPEGGGRCQAHVTKSAMMLLLALP